MQDFALLILVFSAAHSVCYGYVDPGAGHLLFQAFFAGIVGSLFAFKKWLRTLQGRDQQDTSSSN